MDRLRRQLAFLVTLDRLKSVLRRSYTLEGRRENAAEHSWHAAVAALLLAEHAAQPVDVAKVVTLLLLHDLVEIEAGDTYLYDEAAVNQQQAREREAAAQLFAQLPPDQQAIWQALWEEFEAAVSPEARFARGLDRLLPVLLNLATLGRSWREHGIRASQVLSRNQAIAEASPALWQEVQRLVQQAVAQGLLES